MYVLPENHAVLCPLCRTPLAVCGPSLVCGGARRHTFDIARSGYVNLNMHASASGDAKEMLARRQQFRGRDFTRRSAKRWLKRQAAVRCFAMRVAGKAITPSARQRRLTLRSAPIFLNMRWRLPAKARGARFARTKLLYMTASVYALPLADNVCDCVLNVFAPCAAAEFCRVLRPGGRLVIAAAGRDHLLEMKRFLYDEALPNEERRDYPKNLTLLQKFALRSRAEVSKDALLSLFQMTPYFYRTKKERADALGTLSFLPLTLDFEIRIYIKEA